MTYDLLFGKNKIKIKQNKLVNQYQRFQSLILFFNDSFVFKQEMNIVKHRKSS